MRGTRPLESNEIEEILKAIKGPTAVRQRAIFVTGLKTGLRISCILSLQVDDIWDGKAMRGRIRIRRSTTKGKRSGYDMSLHPEAAAALHAQIKTLQDTRPGAFVFPRQDGKAPLHRVQAWKSFKRVLAKAGLEGARGELGWHATRKTYARKVYEALGHDLVRTAYALRHSCVSKTIRYLSFNEADVDQIILGL